MAKSTIVHINVSSAVGGGPRVMWEIVKGLKNDYRHVVIAPQGPYLNRYQNLSRSPNIKISTYPLPVRSYNPLLIFKIGRILKRENARLVHTHGKGAGIWGRLAARISKVPVIHTYHGLHYRDYRPLLRCLYLILERYLSKLAVALVHGGETEQHEARNLEIHKDGLEVHVIHNGVDVKKLCRLTQTSFRESQPCQQIHIIMIGRLLSSQKNQRLALRIIKSLPKSFKLIIVGDGPDGNNLESKIKNLKLQGRVKLLGRLDHKSALKELAKADIYLSTSRWEGLPLTILEAGALEKPVVASDIPAHRELIASGQSGFLYSLNRPDQAARYIQKLKTDPKLRRRLGRRLYQKVAKEFSLTAMIVAYRHLYDQTIEEGL